MYTVDEELRETLWEHKMLQDGIDAYHKALEGKDLLETSIGVRILTENVPMVAAEIRARQEELFDSSKRARRASQVLFPMADAETLAVAALQTAIRRSMTGDGDFRGLLDTLAGAFVEAVALEAWKNQEPDVFARFWRINGDRLSGGANEKRRAQLRKSLAQRWEALQEQLQTFSQADMLDVGTSLFDCVGYTRWRVVTDEQAAAIPEEDLAVVEGLLCARGASTGPCNHLFWVVEHIDKGKEVRSVVLSDGLLDLIDWRIERGAHLSPALRPMLVKPLPWVLTTDADID